MARPRQRLLTWVILAWIVITLIAAFNFAARDQACTAQAGLDRLGCHWQARVGFRAAIGWLVVGTIVLGIIWIITQPRAKTRECPACGSDVRKGVTRCQVCGHDFAVAARGATPSAMPRTNPPQQYPPPPDAPSGGVPPPDIPPPAE